MFHVITYKVRSPIVLSCLITCGVPLLKLNTRKKGIIQATLGNLVNEL